MLKLAGGFAQRGLDVDLVLSRAEGPYLSEVPEAVRVVDLGATRVLRSLPSLSRYLRSNRPQALLSTLGISATATVDRVCRSYLCTCLFIYILMNT